MNTIAYLIYGARRDYELELTLKAYQLELTYSVLSAVHWGGVDRSSLRIVLITDEANQRPDLPVENVLFSAEEFANWTQNGLYKHEAKIHALSKVINLFKGKVALVDTDTYFHTNPLQLFEQIGPGRSVMHAYEGMLGDQQYLSPLFEKLRDVSISYPVSYQTRCFNSGVVGVDYHDRQLIEEVPPLLKELYSYYPLDSIEQLSFSIVLDQRTVLTDCVKLIRHYYGYERGFINAAIADQFPEFSAEIFQRHQMSLPAVAGFPKKRRLDQLKARWKTMIRCEGANYRFAYLAYLSALSSASSSPRNADIWSRIAVDMLRQHRLFSEYVQRDFLALRQPEDCPWLSEATRKVWTFFWQEVAKANEKRTQI